LEGASFMRSLRHAAFALAACVIIHSSSRAAIPSDPAEVAKIVGQPTALEAAPASVSLTGPRGLQQLLVSGRYADGTVRDLTSFATWKVEQPDLVEINDAFV